MRSCLVWGLSALMAILILGLPDVAAFAWIEDVGVQIGVQQRDPVHGEEAIYFSKGSVEYPWTVSYWSCEYKWIGDCGHQTEYWNVSSGYGA